MDGAFLPLRELRLITVDLAELEVLVLDGGSGEVDGREYDVLLRGFRMEERRSGGEGREAKIRVQRGAAGLSDDSVGSSSEKCVRFVAGVGGGDDGNDGREEED